MAQTRRTTSSRLWTLTSLVLYVTMAAMTSALPAPVPATGSRRHHHQPLSDDINPRESSESAASKVEASVRSSTTVSAADDDDDDGVLGRRVLACPRGQFFSQERMACRVCSGCPINQIIRQPCSPLADTLCGPFLEFDQFHQSSGSSSASAAHRAQNAALGAHGEGEDSHGQGQGADHQVTGSGAEGGVRQWTAEERTLQKAGEQWRALCFALITVLAFICIIVVVVGFYVCIMLRRSQSHKLVLREPEFMVPVPYHQDSEPRYVEIVTSRDRLRTSRQQPVYEQIVAGGDYCDLVSPDFPLTSAATCDVKSTDDVVRGADGAEQLGVYINTALLDQDVRNS